jgi:hypothetical protein
VLFCALLAAGERIHTFTLVVVKHTHSQMQRAIADKDAELAHLRLQTDLQNELHQADAELAGVVGVLQVWTDGCGLCP